MPFDILFQEKKDDAFLRNIVNKHFVINATLIELKKPGCNVHDVNAYYSYDVGIDITKLSVQSPLNIL